MEEGGERWLDGLKSSRRGRGRIEIGLESWNDS